MALAQAAAVLGDGCSLHLAAELARLDEETAVFQASRLEVASILQHGDPVEFLHPLLRAAVEAELPEVVRGELHARAAKLLWLSREAPESVALHLVNSPGSGDDEVAEFLAEEGESALEAGSIALATQLLRRAFDEPAPTWACCRGSWWRSAGPSTRWVGLEAARGATSRPRWCPRPRPSC